MYCCSLVFFYRILIMPPPPHIKPIFLYNNPIPYPFRLSKALISLPSYKFPCVQNSYCIVMASKGAIRDVELTTINYIVY